MAKTLNVFETFSGIGAQHKALTNIFNNPEMVSKNKLHNKQFKMVGTSEWYIDGIIAYDVIHHGKQENFPGFDTLEKEEILDFLKGYDLSRDSKNLYPFSKIEKLKLDLLKKIYVGIKRNKNYGSIIDIKGKDLPKIDLLTYSFPCQDISNIGHGKGLSRDNQCSNDTATRSGLLWEIERILYELKDLNKLPRFLVMENVKALFQKKHIEDWNSFDVVLQEMGYKNTSLILNANDFGIPQSRERVFVISELHGITNLNIDKPGRGDIAIGDFLDFNNEDLLQERLDAIPNNTPTRVKTWDLNKKVYFDTDHFSTLTTKVDRNPNCGCIHYPNNEKQTTKDGNKIKKSQFRYPTPREALLLMGFTNEDFLRVKDADFGNKETIYKLAGNSIVVNVLEGIFSSILKRF